MNKLLPPVSTAPRTGQTVGPGASEMVKPPRVRPRVKTQWLALSAALVVLAGVVVSWSLSRAADRVGVVQLARNVHSGQQFTIDDLQIAEVAVDAAVRGLVPGASLQELVGRVASVDLEPGVLLSVGMWRSVPKMGPGERNVGVVLKPGRAPSSLAVGDIATAASADPAVVSPPVTVRVLGATVKDDGSVAVDLAVPSAQSVRVAQLAAAEQLVLVVRPVGATS